MEGPRDGNRGELSADDMLNSCAIGPEGLLNCSFCWAREKDMGHGISEPNNDTPSISLRPPKVMDRKRPCKGLRKES